LTFSHEVRLGREKKGGKKLGELLRRKTLVLSTHAVVLKRKRNMRNSSTKYCPYVKKKGERQPEPLARKDQGKKGNSI